MANKLNIYIPNAGCHDFSGASRYGELITLTKGKLNLFSMGGMYREIEPIIRLSSPQDYILICGPTIANVITCSIFSSIHNRLNLLIYHIGADGIGRYKRRHISIQK